MSSNNKDIKLKQAIRIANSRSYQERSVPKFLKKIYYILEDNKHNELLAWSNDGLAMIIKRPTDFANKVLPLYFKHNNFSSFIRQLNMYQFKKRKNSHYDHIYTHESFQRGKIDLLRNIQRRTNDTSNVVPVEPHSANSDHDVEIDRILQENAQYKRIHKLLYTQVEYIENKMKDIKNEVTALHYEQERRIANEKFLKNVLKSLTKAYGFENIAKVIENDVEENGELSAVDCTKLNFSVEDEEVQAQDSILKHGSLSQLQRSNSEEEGFVEKTYQTSCEFQVSEQLPTNDTPQENFLALGHKNGQVDETNGILQVENWDQLGEVPNEDDNFPNATLAKQFERIKSNNSSELVFCRTSSWFIGDLNNDDLMRNKSNNQIMCDF